MRWVFHLNLVIDRFGEVLGLQRMCFVIIGLIDQLF